MKFRLLVLSFFAFGSAVAQTDLNPITTTVPFLTFTPDAKASGLGDAGVASKADAYSSYWNPAKIVRAEEDFQVGVSYSPWLRNLIDDMGIFHVSMAKKINDNSGFGVSLTYFDQGDIQFTDNQGNPLDKVQSRDFSLTGSYALRLNQNWSLGGNLKYISSNLTGNVNVGGSVSKPGRTVAGEVGVYYEKENLGEPKPVNVAFGAMIQNIGGKLNYGYGEGYIPANLKIGSRLTYNKDDFNSFNLLLDFNKLLVPTPDITTSTTTVGTEPLPSSIGQIFKSFGDAPGGFSEELSEISTSVGLEYDYNNIFAARVGYNYLSPKKGDVQYVTTGLGLKLQERYGLDLSYLIPLGGTNNSLANTYRIGLNILFGDDSKIGVSKDRI